MKEDIGLQPLAEYDSDDDTHPLLPSSLIGLASKPTVRRSPLRLALVLTLALVVTATVRLAWTSTGTPDLARSLSPPSSPTPTLHEEHGVPPSAAAQWLTSHTNTEGTIPFSRALYTPLVPLRALEPTLSIKGFSDECLEGWIADGQLCPALEGHWKGAGAPRLDVVWTWVNGSEAELLSTWRSEVSAQVEANRMVKRAAGAAIKKHFRDHDELRHSIRSIVKAFSSSSLRALHLIVADTPACAPADQVCLATGPADGLHKAQVPHWLNFSAGIELAPGHHTMVTSTIPEDAPTRFVVVPHSAIFKSPVYTDDKTEDNFAKALESDVHDGEDWRRNVVPSFNSLAIESQIPNLEGVTDTLINMNDDFFVLRELAVSDVSSPLTGPVFRLQRNLGIKGVSLADTHDDPDGEWRGLGYTNWLLDQRFGKRERPYLVHEGKSVSMPILREAQHTFIDQLTATAEARFRGKSPGEVQSSFLLVHYTIEKHREALLWSFFFGRSDENQDGVFSPTERQALLTNIGYNGEGTISVPRPVRDPLGLNESYAFAGLKPPKETKMLFSSRDGFALFVPDGDNRDSPWPSFQDDRSSDACTIDIDLCFGDDFTSPSSTVSLPVADAFRRVAFVNTRCGDCIIIELLRRSPRLSAFLPSAVSPASPIISSTKAPSHIVDAVGLSPSFLTASFHLSNASLSTIRQRCITLIARYSYVLGDSTSKFVAVRSQWTLTAALRAMERDGQLPAFLAINDDIVATASNLTLKAVDSLMGKWFQEVLGEKTKWEM